MSKNSVAPKRCRVVFRTEELASKPLQTAIKASGTFAFNSFRGERCQSVRTFLQGSGRSWALSDGRSRLLQYAAVGLPYVREIVIVPDPDVAALKAIDDGARRWSA